VAQDTADRGALHANAGVVQGGFCARDVTRDPAGRKYDLFCDVYLIFL